MDEMDATEPQQNLSRPLARSEDREMFSDSNRGLPVAPLTPFSNDPWNQLLDSGRVLLPSSD